MANDEDEAKTLLPSNWQVILAELFNFWAQDAWTWDASCDQQASL